MDVMLTIGKSWHRLSELYAGKFVRNSCFGFGTYSQGSLHCSDTMFAYVLLHMGDIPHSHVVLGVFQRSYRYGGLFTPSNFLLI